MKYQSDKLALQKRCENAYAEVERLKLPETIELNASSFIGLNEKFQNVARRGLKNLTGIHGKNLPYLFGVSLKEAWFSLWETAYHFRDAIEGGVVPDDAHYQRLTTAKGYADVTGWAIALDESLAKIEIAPIRASLKLGTPYMEVDVTAEDILQCISLYFFSLAATEMRNGRIKKTLDWLYEATQARDLSFALYMWHEGARIEEERNEEDVLSKFSRAGANARHAENRAMKLQVFGWCDKNIQNFGSLDSAAEAARKIVPVTFRTVRDWIGEWKKIRSAGKR